MADKKPEEAAPAATAPAAGGGGIKAWLPLIVTLVAMPALAFGTMNFLILPKMQKAAGGGKAAAASQEAAGGHGEAEPAEAGGHGKEAAAEEPKAAEAGAHGGAKASEENAKTEAQGAVKSANGQTFRLEKVIVNVAGTSGTRYIMSTLVMKGTSPKFEKILTENRDQLLDIATGILGSKTIADLEKPGARQQLKIELMSVFNTALGQSLVKEIFIPEWAIQ